MSCQTKQGWSGSMCFLCIITFTVRLDVCSVGILNFCHGHGLKSVAARMSCRRTCAVWAQLLWFYSFIFYILHLGLENIYLECRNLSTTMCKSSVNSCDWRIVVKEEGPLSGGGRGCGFEWQYKEWERYADRYSGAVSRASSAVTRATEHSITLG